MSHDETSPESDVHVRHVLVPLDGSELALRAVPTARALAGRLGAVVHVVSVAETEEDAVRLRALGAAVLDVDPGGDRVAVVVGTDPVAAISERAEALDSALLCMSTHGRGRLSGALVGSVARSVLQQSAHPIVVLGPSADNPGWTPKPRNWPEPLSVPRIIACVDGSGASEQILPIAGTWASALGMSMTVLTVAEDVPRSLDREPRDKGYGSHPDAESYIHELVQRWTPEGVPVDGQVVRDPIGPASGLRTHLSERPAGLVALTTHARSGMQRALLGATAASIVHASVSPCLVAPGAWF
jgi:nucleotide-binding universal stress UspA family protein